MIFWPAQLGHEYFLNSHENDKIEHAQLIDESFVSPFERDCQSRSWKEI